MSRLIGGYYDEHLPSGYLSVEHGPDGKMVGSFNQTYKDALVSVASYEDDAEHYEIWYWVPDMDESIEGWVAAEQGLEGVSA